MKPTLIEFPHISSYSVFMLLGFAFGWWLARRRAANTDIAKRHIDNLVLILLLVGPLGARLAARLFYMPQLSIADAFKVWEGGGLVFYGGFFLSVAAIVAYGLAMKLPLRRLCDLLAPSAALGLAFGRIGCFLAGCCWGDLILPADSKVALEPAKEYQVRTLPALSPQFVAVQFPQKSDAYKQHAKLGLVQKSDTRSLPVHPVQLYEAVFALLMTIWLAKRKALFEGEVAIRLLVAYSVGRFVIEFFRADNQPIYTGMTFSQVTSLLILGVAILAVRLKARAAAAPYMPRPASAQT